MKKVVLLFFMLFSIGSFEDFESSLKSDGKSDRINIDVFKKCVIEANGNLESTVRECGERGQKLKSFFKEKVVDKIIERLKEHLKKDVRNPLAFSVIFSACNKELQSSNPSVFVNFNNASDCEILVIFPETSENILFSQSF